MCHNSYFIILADGITNLEMVNNYIIFFKSREVAGIDFTVDFTQIYLVRFISGKSRNGKWQAKYVLYKSHFDRLLCFPI